MKVKEKIIDSSSGYYRAFGAEDCEDAQGETLLKYSHLSTALKEAQENRRFEIGNYWKRAGYFWAFVTVIYTAFYNVFLNIYEKEKWHIPLVILSGLAFLFCMAFYLSNIASKHWQDNWETHQCLLEKKVYGSLYSVWLSGKEFSVSRINRMLSFVCMICSGVFFAYEIIVCIDHYFSDANMKFLMLVMAFLCVLFFFLAFIFLSRGQGLKRDNIKFRQVDYE